MLVSIIGAGIVGKATGIGLQQYGYDVIFHDTDPGALDRLAEEGYEVAEGVEGVRKSHIHMICVPTPLKNNNFNLRFLESAVKQVAKGMARKDGYQVIVVRSTVLPFTVRARIIPLLERYCPMKLGEEYGVCHNPEFLRAAHALEDFLNPPIIVIGEADKRSGDMLAELYAPFPAPRFRTSLENAEAIKCFSNVYNALKVSFFNEVYLIAQKCGLDHEAISQAMLKSSLGICIPEYYTKGGFPFGGGCLPKDLAASTSFVNEWGLNTHLFEAVAEINEEMKKLEVNRHRD
jgi:nucleotide sugar dehydrogenase